MKLLGRLPHLLKRPHLLQVLLVDMLHLRTFFLILQEAGVLDLHQSWHLVLDTANYMKELIKYYLCARLAQIWEVHSMLHAGCHLVEVMQMR